MTWVESAIFWILSQTGWTPALIVSTIAGLAMHVFNTYSKSKVENRFHRKLEELKSSLRIEEEKLKANIKSRDDEIASLRNSLLSRISNQHGDVDKRRIAAAENLWSSVIDESRHLATARMFSSLKFDVMLRMSSSGGENSKKIQNAADHFIKMFKIEDVNINLNSDKDRPFLTPISWSLFSAYRVILHYPIIMMHSVRAGLEEAIDTKYLSDILKIVFPDRNYSFDNYNMSFIPGLAVEIQEKILEEIRRGIYQPFSDENSASQARAIISVIDAATDAMENLQKSEEAESVIKKMTE